MREEVESSQAFYFELGFIRKCLLLKTQQICRFVHKTQKVAFLSFGCVLEGCHV